MPGLNDASNTPFSLILDNAMTTEAIMNAGVKKAHLPTYKMILLGTLAGVYIGFGAQLMYSLLYAGEGETAKGPQKFLGGIGFSVALILIVGVGAELFTGNCLLIVGVLAKRITIRELLFDWFFVYFSNFFGAILMAAMIYGTGINGYKPSELTHPGEIACSVAVAKASLDPHEIFLRGIGANMLVCLAVLLGVASKTPTGKFVGLAFPIAAFVSIGFEHSIANMFIFSLATMLRCEGVHHGEYWLNLLMCTIGNILGAAFLAVNYWTAYIHHSHHHRHTVHGVVEGSGDESMPVLQGTSPAAGQLSVPENSAKPAPSEPVE